MNRRSGGVVRRATVCGQLCLTREAGSRARGLLRQWIEGEADESRVKPLHKGLDGLGQLLRDVSLVTWGEGRGRGGVNVGVGVGLSRPHR